MDAVQDPDPMPWGAQDRYQAHYIVRRQGGPEMTARTVVSTSGHFGSKKVERVRWEGAGALADALNADAELGKMLAAMGPARAHMFVDPTESGVRIYGAWRARDSLAVTREEFAAYERIAGHVKAA